MSERADSLSYPPRGLHLWQAAIYVGLSDAEFAQLVEDGRMPQPLTDGNRLAWPKASLDAAFTALGREGTIYVIQALPGTPIKIGFTRFENAKSRVAELQTGNPHPLRVLVTARGRPDHERAAHIALAAHRLTGEWFAWSPATERFVVALALGIDEALALARKT